MSRAIRAAFLTATTLAVVALLLAFAFAVTWVSQWSLVAGATLFGVVIVTGVFTAFFVLD